MNLLLPILVFALPRFIWSIITRTIPYGAPFDLTNKNITFLISHPDDEVMFFGPSLALLTIPEFNNTVSIVSLSSGNSEGLGATRKIELARSAWYFAIPPSRLFVVENEEDFPDSMEAAWDPKLISDVLGDIPAISNTDAIVTFDSQGVSAHTNHIATGKGASLYVQEHSDVGLWKLETVSIYRKYLMFFDAFISYYAVPWVRKVHEQIYDSEWAAKYDLLKHIPEPTAEPVRASIISRQVQFTQAKSAMIKAHESQMKWYRHGWVIFSRYMIVNDLIKEN
ncbi:Gpi12p [Sugiyamaella lignohabitans]|uniref:N-acetylglucosaminylphosphatidylinositol deacetylase n=1 Tax=Sugiyamaella lignohabitans TaxID=796027 RepID=A0A167EWW1_9ASCO|nr:Gpi12p [Sugiyamaella lignohabitans]ANB14552.1 Gpi12p [Sugiyamaella lignohabitans]